MKFWGKYLQKKGSRILLFAITCAFFTLILVLYRLPWTAIFYPLLLCFLMGGGYLLADILRLQKKRKALENLRSLPDTLTQSLSLFDGLEDEAYQAIIGALLEKQRHLLTQVAAKEADRRDYYTTWFHQIKTPIASMHLTLQKEDSPLARQISGDLFRIEQYADMVMTYLRLEEGGNDFVFKSYALDPILKHSIRRFAGQFIAKGIALHYTPTQENVVTDEKWLSFLLEQLLSNALKYTHSGSITVRVEPQCTLAVEDTGMGIAPEDLPRVFDKGYTGHNGRQDSHASGLGLYLCHRVCNTLEIPISITSTPGVGTCVRLELGKTHAVYE